MTDPASPGAPAVETRSYPPAGLDRRFYAFAADRAVGWGLAAAAVAIAWALFLDQGRTATGIGVIVGALLGIGIAFAVVQGLTGLTPGKALLGLRTARHDTGGTIGVGRALLRGAVLGLATLPTFGLGLATLAWTAVMDPGRQRRGWHDLLARSVVVDVRPAAPDEVTSDSGPRQVVNLTALRLVPAPGPPEPVAAPRPAARRRVLPPPAPAPQPAAEQPVAEQAPPPDPGRTVVRGSGAATGLAWQVAFDTGESFVVEGLGLVGRRPEARPGEPVRHVVPLPSADMSLSKTHAQFHLDPDGVLVVMDRGSTNGSVVVRQGVTRDLVAGRPATLLDGDTVTFGDRRMTVTRVS